MAAWERDNSLNRVNTRFTTAPAPARMIQGYAISRGFDGETRKISIIHSRCQNTQLNVNFYAIFNSAF